MANNLLAFLAYLTLAAAEFSLPSSLKISAILVATAIALLILASHQGYFILAALLTLSSGSFAAILKFRPSPTYEDDDCKPSNNNKKNCCKRFMNVLPSILAGCFHELAMFHLPFLILYMLTEARRDPRFSIRELGHLVPGSFMIMCWATLPTVIFYKGLNAPKCLKNQLVESTAYFCFAVIFVTVYRIVHHNLGNDPPVMLAFDWDHELLGWVVFGSSLMGIFLSLGKIETDIHVVFPTVYIALNMLNHTDPTHHAAMNENGPKWKPTWMKLHVVHGILLFIGTACRLVGRRTESVCFYYISIHILSMSSIFVVNAFYKTFNNPDDKDFAAEHIIPLQIVALVTVNCAMFMGTGVHVRKFLDKDYDSRSVSFQALATEEPTVVDGFHDEEDAYFTNGYNGKENGTLKRRDHHVVHAENGTY